MKRAKHWAKALMNESTDEMTLGRTERDWRERKLRGYRPYRSLKERVLCSKFKKKKGNLYLRVYFPLYCLTRSDWTAGSQPLEKQNKESDKITKKVKMCRKWKLLVYKHLAVWWKIRQFWCAATVTVCRPRAAPHTDVLNIPLGHMKRSIWCVAICWLS